MSNTANGHCTTLEQLDPAQAINAIHAALMQLNAAESGVENLDNKDAIAGLVECLKTAGHIGFESKGPTAPGEGIKGINVRFFCYAWDETGAPDIVETTESEFLKLGGEISYERHSVFENGCHQICLTTDACRDE